MSEVDRFAEFCGAVLTDPDGSPLELYPEQRTMLSDYFSGVRETLILLPKKNGKTGMAAALALHHLLTTPFAECFIAAASRDQANRLLEALAGYVKRSPELSARVRLKQREVVHEGNAGFVRVLAADTDTSDGVTPTLAIVDELHRHKSGELAGLLRDGLGPRSGRMLTISTAGEDEESPLGKLRKAAYELPGMVREGAHRYVRAGDDFAMHEWALDLEDNVHDLALVKTANPAPWIDLEELRQRHDSPSTQPWQWARFACGQWVAGEFAAFSALDWQRCAVSELTVPEGARGPFVGVDLGWKVDPTAIVGVWIDGGGWRKAFRVVRPGDAWGRGRAGVWEWQKDGREQTAYVGHVKVIPSPRDGTMTPVETIFAACAEVARKWPEATFVFDPRADGSVIAQKVEAELGVTVAEYSQMNTAMVLAAGTLQALIASGRLRHPDDETLNAHVLGAGVKPVGEAWRLGKQPGRDNDAAIALAMACAVGMAEGSSEEPPEEPAAGHYWAGGFS